MADLNAPIIGATMVMVRRGRTPKAHNRFQLQRSLIWRVRLYRWR